MDGLLGLGVEEIELGWMGQEGLVELADWAGKRVRDQGLSTALSVWTPCRLGDIGRAAPLGLDRVNMGVPVSDPHLALRLGMDRTALLDNLARAVLYAKVAGVGFLSVGLEDVSRTGEDFALEAARTARAAGADRVRLADTVGRLTPLETARLVERFRREADCPLAVHCHDDFGMATANAATALQAGAEFADASLLGLGERAGIAATEELAAHLALRGVRSYRMEGVRDLCSLAAGHSGMEIPRSKAVAGADIFASESGLHVHGLHKSPALFEPFDPSVLGAVRTLGYGTKIGRGAVRDALADHGRTIPAAGLDRAVDRVRRASAAEGRPLTSSEVASMVLLDRSLSNPSEETP